MSISIDLPQVEDHDVLQTICAVLIACYRFRKFTESRWLTIGASTRVLTVAVLMGLDSLVEYIKKDEGSPRNLDG